MAGEDQGVALGELRRDIDRIDAAVHGLLMERGLIIDRLIAAKGGTAATGSAFRPEREASMMAVLAGRHRGLLPFDAVEGIWRVIISTFTHVQAPFSVHADISEEPDAMRDSARFHFGFSVPLASHRGSESALAALSASRGDLALLPASGSREAWWRRLVPEGGPTIIARLPFVDRPDHPASLPVLVVAKGVSGEGTGAVVLYALEGAADPRVLGDLGADLVASVEGSSLVAVPRDVSADTVAARLGTAARPVGSHPVAVRTGT